MDANTNADAELIVVADDAGNILAVADLDYREPVAPDAPSSVEILPLEGQTVRKVTKPEELARTNAGDVFQDYHLQIEGQEARLVRRSANNS
jgi:hypothetical protein